MTALYWHLTRGPIEVQSVEDMGWASVFSSSPLGNVVSVSIPFLVSIHLTAHCEHAVIRHSISTA